MLGARRAHLVRVRAEQFTQRQAAHVVRMAAQRAERFDTGEPVIADPIRAVVDARRLKQANAADGAKQKQNDCKARAETRTDLEGIEKRH